MTGLTACPPAKAGADGKGGPPKPTVVACLIHKHDHTTRVLPLFSGGHPRGRTGANSGTAQTIPARHRTRRWTGRALHGIRIATAGPRGNSARSAIATRREG